MARVVLISVVYPPDKVSTASIVHGLAINLHKLGHEVGVLSSVPHYNPPEDEVQHHGRISLTTRSTEEDVEVVRCFVPRKTGSVKRRAFDFAIFHVTLVAGALRHFRKAEYAIVVSPPLTLFFVAYLLRLISGTRVIYNVQELWPDVPRDLGVVKSRPLLRLLAAVERFIYRRAHLVTVIGDRFRDAVSSRSGRGTGIEVIPNFVDSSWIVPRPKANKLADSWEVSHRPVVLYAGNIGLTQDFDLLLDAAGALPEVSFVVVGGGAGHSTLADDMASRCLPNVQLRDFVPAADVPDLYGLSDIVAVPLKPGHDRTTTPSKIFSAMAAERPVLACAAPDTDLALEITQHRAGAVVEPSDLEGFVAAVRTLLSEPELYFSPAAVAARVRELSPTNIANRYSGLLR